MGEDKIKAFSTKIRDELFLLGLLTSFIGIVSTESYYDTFGIAYQFLSIPTFHFIYRGITVILEAPYVLIPYLITVLWLWYDEHFGLTCQSYLKWRGIVGYLLIAVLLIGTYLISRNAGSKIGQTNLRAATCKLTKIVSLKSKTESVSATDDYRLLIIDNNYITVFKPLARDDKAAYPNIRRFAKGETNEFITTSK